MEYWCLPSASAHITTAVILFLASRPCCLDDIIIYFVSSINFLCGGILQVGFQYLLSISHVQMVIGHVVVNFCFTSLFGTNGLLSDIVIQKNVVVN